jgi:site-specific recombinase XerD
MITIMNQLAKTQSAQIPELTRQLILDSRAKNTKRAYESDWRDFVAFCEKQGLQYMPSTPQVVCAYILNLSTTKKFSTIRRRVSSITVAHKMANKPNPVDNFVKTVLSGLARNIKAKSTKKKAITVKQLRAFFQDGDNTITRVRDKTILYLSFAGGFRRGELVALDVDDVDFTDSGMTLLVRRSKTDQEGRGHVKTIGYGKQTCPVAALKEWLKESGITGGAIFRPISKSGRVLDRRLSDQCVALIVKKYIKEIGDDPALYSGHSVRSGLVTAAKMAGVSTEDIMRITNHKTQSMIERYYQGGERIQYGVAEKIGM